MWMVAVGALLILLFAAYGNSGTSGSGTGTGSASVGDTASTTPRARFQPQAAEPAPATEVPTQPVNAETAPRVGTGGVFSAAEIRYCLSESIRIEMWRSHLKSDARASLRAFNAAVDDYNSRCSSFRYRRDTFARVSAEVEANRPLLRQQALSRAASAEASVFPPVQAEPTAAAAPAYVDASSNAATSAMPPIITPPMPAQTFQTSFDCNRANADAERIICNDAELAASDVALAALFAQARAASVDKDAFKQHAREQWNDRERNCHDRECLMQWYARQNEWLSAFLSNRPSPETKAEQVPTAPQAHAALSTAVSLSADERSSIESACSTDKYTRGPAAYNACANSKLQELAQSPRDIDLSSLNAGEKSSIVSACSTERYVRGPGAYNRCLTAKLAELNSAPRNVDLSSLSVDERSSIESSCSTERYVQGPAAYDRCLADKVAELANAPRDIDLSSLSVEEKSSIDSACSTAKYVNGPAALNRCRSLQLAKLESAPRHIDLSALDDAQRSSIMSACSHEKYVNGPADYNKCLARHLR
jgi:uncharacterized protein